MKKGLLIILAAVIALLSAACASYGISKNAKIETGSSEKFTDSEIRQAADAVKKAFKKFNDCELLSLVYDEEKSNAEIESYLKNGKGVDNGAEAENTIILFSEFYAGSKADGGFTPNMEYKNWMFILIRDNKNSPWRVDDWGY